jgi:XTP/dITP diphosphohydrolase
MVHSTIFLASANPDKISELKELLSPLGVKLQSTRDVPNPSEVVEDLPTLQGNALKKAQYWYEESGLPSLADDTGLEVDALNGEPGVYSARYAGSEATYRDNLEKLLKEMLGEENRSAQFRTALVFVHKGGIELFEGVCHGEILKKPRGEKGFGYDPIFRPDGYDKSFAELSSEEKNRISHRGRALKKFLLYLERESNNTRNR